MQRVTEAEDDAEISDPECHGDGEKDNISGVLVRIA